MIINIMPIRRFELLAALLASSILSGGVSKQSEGEQRDVCGSSPSVLAQGTGWVYHLTTSDTMSANLDCALLLEACDNCHIRLYVEKLELPTCHGADPCSCSFLRIFVENGENEKLCDTLEEPYVMYISSNLVQIIYFINKVAEYSGDLQIKYEIIDVKRVIGTSGVTGSFLSPNFPSSPGNINHGNYTVINDYSQGTIQLVFDDFLIPAESELKIFEDANFRTELVDSFSGDIFRPPPIQSTSGFLQIIYNSNNVAGYTGFKASYTHVSGRSWVTKPHSDNCQGEIKSVGGHLSRPKDNEGKSIGYFDCLWILRKMKEDHMLYIKVENFYIQNRDEEHFYNLEIRDGDHSESELLAQLGGTADDIYNLPYSGFTSADNFYVRLQSKFNVSDDLQIAFSEFSNEYEPGSYGCLNGHFISYSLVCDGHDHCGDWSDETLEYCPKIPIPPTPTSSDEGNYDGFYYFGIFAVGLLTAGIVFSLVASVFMKIRKRNSDSSRMSSVPTVSESLDTSDGQNGEGQISTVNGNIWLPDFPPSYDDTMRNHGIAIEMTRMQRANPPPQYGHTVMAADELLAASNTSTILHINGQNEMLATNGCNGNNNVQSGYCNPVYESEDDSSYTDTAIQADIVASVSNSPRNAIAVQSSAPHITTLQCRRCLNNDNRFCDSCCATMMMEAAAQGCHIARERHGVKRPHVTDSSSDEANNYVRMRNTGLSTVLDGQQHNNPTITIHEGRTSDDPRSAESTVNLLPANNRHKIELRSRRQAFSISSATSSSSDDDLQRLTRLLPLQEQLLLANARFPASAASPVSGRLSTSTISSLTAPSSNQSFRSSTETLTSEDNVATDEPTRVHRNLVLLAGNTSANEQIQLCSESEMLQRNHINGTNECEV